MSAFLAEKQFVGCNGLVVTDEIRATIAALACLLVLGRRGHYDELHSILVYPTAFWVEDEVRGRGRRRRRSGAACCRARPGIRAASSCPGKTCSRPRTRPATATTSRCTSSRTTSTPRDSACPPRLARRAGEVAAARVRAIVDWADDLADEFDALLDAVDRGEDTFLDPYAAEDEAEFFAVATEDFFERPVELRAAHPRLYGLLQEFYALDPASWATHGLRSGPRR